MTQSVSFQGYHIHTSKEGQGENLLFLHGWPTNSLLWEAQAEILQKQFRVLRLDWLGFGRSDKPLDFPYSFSQMKACLDTVIEELLSPDERLSLVAHDIGGPAAILWAYENPHRVERLILLNTVLYPLKTPLDAISELILATPFLKDIFVSPWGLKQVLKTNTQSRGIELKERIEEILSAYHRGVPSALKKQSLHGPMHEGRKNELLSLSSKFQELDCPKHLVIAKKDPLCYAHIHKLSQENPEVPVYPIENCGHFIPIDRPHALNLILQNILRKEIPA